MKHTYGSKIASIPNSLERLLDLYDEGQLPPDDIIEMCQQMIDMDLDDYLTPVSYTHLTLPTICSV